MFVPELIVIMGFTFPFRDSRDIHELIFDIAAHHRPSDMEAPYRRLPNQRLFAPVQVPAHLPAGTSVADGTQRFTIRLVSRPGAGNFLPFFFDANHPRLSGGFAEFSAHDAFTMVSQAADDIAGLILQNRRGSWVALKRAEVVRLVANGVLR